MMPERRYNPFEAQLLEISRKLERRVSTLETLDMPRSLGATTFYVDPTNGSDVPGGGLSVGSGAFATIAFCLDQIPAVFDGNIVIVLAADNFNEAVTIKGKAPSGNYTITFRGTLTTTQAAINVDGGVTTSGSTRGTVTDSGSGYGAWDNLLLQCSAGDNAGLTYLIDLAAAGTLSMVGGPWSAFAAGGTYNVLDWGSVIQQTFTVGEDQKFVVFEDIHFDPASGNALTGSAYSSCTTQRCKFSGATNGIVISRNGLLSALDCFVTPGTVRGINFQGAACIIQRCKVLADAANQVGIDSSLISNMTITAGTVIDGTAAQWFNIACRSSQQSIGSWFTTAANGQNRLINNIVALNALTGGIQQFTTSGLYIFYNNNVTDKSPAGASDPAYID